MTGNGSKPRARAETHRRRCKCGKWRRIVGPRRLLQKYAHSGMDVRAAKARAEGTIFMVARRGAVAVVGAGMGAMKRAGNT